jgi:transposase
VSPNNLAQPSTSFWQWTVQATTQLSLYLLQLNPHTPGNSLSHNFKPAIFYGTTAVVSETKKIEGFWFALAVFGTAFLGGRKPLPEELPRVELVHDIDEADKQCGCGAPLSKIGEDVCEKLDIIPAVIRVIRHVRPKYGCRQCEGIETKNATVTIAPAPKQIIPKGIATAGLLAHILTAKFCDALPFYRQEKQFARLGVELGRATMGNWAIKAATACGPVLALLHTEIRSGPLINIDETTVQVLDGIPSKLE